MTSKKSERQKKLEEFPILTPEFWEREILSMWKTHFKSEMKAMRKQGENTVSLTVRNQAIEAADQASLLLETLKLTEDETYSEIMHSHLMMPPEEYR